VKRDENDPAKLHVVLIQIKGGTAKVTLEEIRRLRKAKDKLEVSWERDRDTGETRSVFECD
jgi:hypothetical protein